jgi:hypothetical protein
VHKAPRGTDDDETTPERETAPSAKDQHAYEDSWYRSLKRLAEARNTGPSDGSDEEDEVPDEGAPPAGP